MAIAVLTYAYIIEWLQYMKILKVFSLQNNELAKVVIGNGFEWMDIVMYTLGIATLLLIERRVTKDKSYA